MASDIWLSLLGLKGCCTDSGLPCKQSNSNLYGLLFPISSKGSFMHHPTDRVIHTTAFGTPVVEYWLEREIAHWVHHEGF